MVAIQYTDRGPAARIGAAGGALTRAALAAMEAPAHFDPHPWHWRIDDDRAALIADHGRRAPDDPDGRLLTVSCGAALHHAVTALAGDGIGADVRRLPDAAEPGLLAVVRCTGPIGTSSRALRLHRANAMRRSDRRPPTDAPIDGSTERVLRSAAQEAGGGLCPLWPSAGRFAITTTGDGPRDWLGAGEALSAVLLNAAAEGLATRVEEFLPAAEATRLAWSMPAGAGRPAVVVGIAPAGRLS
ncbi:hypothetical protein AB0M46_39730 [Dactylosporangium sp. NPDC051485]|uniref:hypothetical protein n=1 Tax=Dactylosporangium sp. NPDC051485 TaxID=3154846 RepID=UPI00341CA35A